MRNSTASRESQPLSKPEAVRRAIAALGYRAEVPDLLAFIEDHFVLVTSGVGESPMAPTVQEVSVSPEEVPVRESLRTPSTKRNKHHG